MQYSIRFTASYRKQKNLFLSTNSFKSALETACKRIDRKLLSQQVTQPEDPLVNLFALYIEYQDTELEPFCYAEICCLCLINRQTSEIAPCAVYFVSDFIKIPLNDRERADLVAAVKTELSW